MGRLTADPDLRTTPNGISVASFSLAVERNFKQGDSRQTDFINIVAWRNTAEFVSRYFKKGQMACVQGSLQIRSYNDRDGNKRTAAEVVADQIYFADSKRDNDSQGGTSQNSYSSYAPARQEEPASFSAGDSDGFSVVDDDDLPF
jgi:single-strand DNA-binding protein